MENSLIFLSGLLSNEFVWTHQTKHLSKCASIQVFSPSQDTPDKMVQAILDKAPPVFALAGHSMGGWLCLEIMKVAPSRVNKLCLLNTTARMDSEEKRKKRQKMIRKTEEGEFPKIAQELAENFVLNPFLRKDVEKMFLQVGVETFLCQQNAMLIREECASILPEITCPTWVVHATEDNVFSLEEHRELVNQIPGAKLAVLEDSGHMSPIEMPQAVTALLRLWFDY